MYLYKYFYKGVNYASFRISTDEPEQYLNGWYLSASEAMCRIFEFDTTRRIPSVQKFAVHLQNQNYVLFKAGNEQTAAEAISDLEQYFERPQDKIFDSPTYLEYFQKYQVTSRRPSSVQSENLWKDVAKEKPFYA